MTTAIDSNVLVALWDPDDSLNRVAQQALDLAQNHGALVIAAPVFAELLAFPARSINFVDLFLSETGIAVDWQLDEAIWRTAGEAFRRYAQKRRRHRGPGPRRILADLLIGAHAAKRNYALLTLDESLYKAAFPALTIVRI